MQVVGEGADTLPRDDTNYIVRGVALAFAQVRLASPTLQPTRNRHSLPSLFPPHPPRPLSTLQVGAEVPPLAYFCKNQIPVGSGLGSSSAGIIRSVVPTHPKCLHPHPRSP